MSPDTGRRSLMKTAGAVSVGLGLKCIPSVEAQQATGATVYVGSGDYEKGEMYALDAETGNEIWSSPIGGEIESSPTVVDGTVYIGGGDFETGIVYALDAETGYERWRSTVGGDLRSSPTVVDSTVYIGSRDNNLYALDAETGDERWSFETEYEIKSATTVVDGTVYVGSTDGNVYALDAETGDEQWIFETCDAIEMSPTVAEDTVYAGDEEGKLYALDASDGTEQWKIQIGDRDQIHSSPSVVKGTVYIGLNSNVYALDAETGDERWRFETGFDVASSPTVVDGTVYVGSDDNNVYALNAETGEEKWRFETGGWVTTSPTVANEIVYVGSDDENVYALDAGDGTEIWSFTTGEYVESSPTVVSDPENGDGIGSRVALGTLGHHDEWAERTEGGADTPESDEVTKRSADCETRVETGDGAEDSLFLPSGSLLSSLARVGGLAGVVVLSAWWMIQSEGTGETTTNSTTQPAGEDTGTHDAEKPSRGASVDGTVGSERSGTKYCPQCGKGLPGEANFCRSCGTEVDRS